MVSTNSLIFEGLFEILIILFFHPSAVAPAYMIMASLLDPGADGQAVRRAGGFRGLPPAVPLPGEGGIMACRATVTSDKRFHLVEAVSILKCSSPTGKAPANALCDLQVLVESEGWARSVVQVRLVIAALEALWQRDKN